MCATPPTRRAYANGCSSTSTACRCCCCTAMSAAASCWWSWTAGATRRARSEQREKGRSAPRRCLLSLLTPIHSLLLHRPLPACQRQLAPARDGELARGRVAGDHRAGADGGLRADRHRRHHRGVGADEGAVPDVGDELVHAVVVAGDGAGAHVDAAADHGVAQVAEVIGLAVLAA